jgi:hypothetical protein
VHDLVTKKYSSKMLRSGKTLRDELNGKPWEGQHARGIAEIDLAWKEHEGRG